MHVKVINKMAAIKKSKRLMETQFSDTCERDCVTD